MIDCVGWVSLKKSDDASNGSVNGSVNARRLLTPKESEESTDDTSESMGGNKLSLCLQ